MSRHGLTAARRRPGPNGEGTRSKLVAAALELFGNKGFHAVGAREIAALAGAPLAAIPYHFGTKEALYRAALERVASGLRRALAEPVLTASQALSGSRDDARRALALFQGQLLDVLAVEPEAEHWAKLLLREHLDPSSAFDIAYEDGAKNAVDLLAGLIARATGKRADNKEMIIQGFAAMGEVLVFRITQNAILRRLGWQAFTTTEAARVRSAMGWSATRTSSRGG